MSKSINSLYIIGSLRNKVVSEVEMSLSALGIDTFAEWLTAGPEADDFLRDYFRERDYTYSMIMNSRAARNIYEFDRMNLDRCDAALMVMPAGKSGHLELGYIIGQNKPGFILMNEEPERVDIMHQFATKIFMNQEEMLDYFSKGG